ncbi:MAG: hypothetical protein PVF21_06555 [Thiohalophilus sp.]|jgi:hypothetical protein
MNKRQPAWMYVVFVVVCAFKLNMAAALDRQNLFDWYYSAVFGTGSYRIGDRDVFVITASYSDTLREASEDKAEIRYTFPVTVGFYDYTADDILELDIPTDVATLTVLPGIHYVLPVTDTWTLKPFIDVGYGKEFDGGEEAWIYSGGIRSLYTIKDDIWHIKLGTSLYYAGNTREATTDLGFAAFDTAIDINRKTNYSIDGQSVYLGGYLGVYLFSNLEFIESDQTTFEISEQYEIGLTMSTRNEFDVLGVKMDRVGIGYLTSPGGFRAWRLVFSFPY